MGDHFVLLVDRLLTESTLEAAIESRNRSMLATPSTVDESKLYSNNESFEKVEFGDISMPRKLVECRICQDEEEDSNMETPCSCRGSLQYAHRRCVQRWCNEKGNITCEICHQQFKPGYTAPPPLFQFGNIPMNFRGNWEITRREPNGPRIIAMVSTDSDLLHPYPTYDDYSVSTTRSLMFCRSFAVIFMVLLILRHTLPVILSGTNEYTLPLFMMLFVRTVGIMLPIYVMVKAVTALLRHRHPMESTNSSSDSSSDESEDSPLPSPAHVVRVR